MARPGAGGAFPRRTAAWPRGVGPLRQRAKRRGRLEASGASQYYDRGRAGRDWRNSVSVSGKPRVPYGRRGRRRTRLLCAAGPAPSWWKTVGPAGSERHTARVARPLTLVRLLNVPQARNRNCSTAAKKILSECSCAPAPWPSQKSVLRACVRSRRARNEEAGEAAGRTWPKPQQRPCSLAASAPRTPDPAGSMKVSVLCQRCSQKLLPAGNYYGGSFTSFQYYTSIVLAVGFFQMLLLQSC